MRKYHWRSSGHSCTSRRARRMMRSPFSIYNKVKAPVIYLILLCIISPTLRGTLTKTMSLKFQNPYCFDPRPFAKKKHYICIYRNSTRSLQGHPIRVQTQRVNLKKVLQSAAASKEEEDQTAPPSRNPKNSPRSIHAKHKNVISSNRKLASCFN
jgi:hypothetical protein